MTVAEKMYTADDLWELSKLPEYTHKHIELWEGIIVQMAPSSAIPSIIAAQLAKFIGIFVDEGNLGYVSTAEGGYKLSDKTVLAPDVGFIAKAHVPKLPKRYFASAPDLAVEVVSPTDKPAAVHRKALKYLEYGVPLVWVAYPDTKTVKVYKNGSNVIILDINGTLDGGNVLPGFTLAVSELFKNLD